MCITKQNKKLDDEGRPATTAKERTGVLCALHVTRQVIEFNSLWKSLVVGNLRASPPLNTSLKRMQSVILIPYTFTNEVFGICPMSNYNFSLELDKTSTCYHINTPSICSKQPDK